MAKYGQCSVAGEQKQVQLIPLVDKHGGGR